MSSWEKRLGSLAGKVSGCPFCLVRGRELPRVGEGVRFLFDEDAGMAGRIGTVVEKQLNYSLGAREVCIELEGDVSGGFQTIDVDQVLVETLPGVPFPAWSLPIRLGEAGGIDDRVIRLIDDGNKPGYSSLNIDNLYYLILYIWQQRVPLESEEVWAVLEAHGVSLDWKDELIKRYQYGIEALVKVTYDRLYRNRRMASFSVWLDSLCKRR